MNALTFRTPEASDAQQISRIDAEGLSTGHASFRESPYDWDGFKAAYMSGRALSRVAVVA